MNADDISINIVNYNNIQFLQNCIKSIYENTKKINFSILIIDNFSSDNSIELIEKTFPTIKIIRNNKNIGFAKAQNTGFDKVDSRYILILNPDTLILDNSIEKMVLFLDRNPEAGIVGPIILNPDKSNQCTGITYPNNVNLLSETLFLDRFFPNNRIFGKHKKTFEPYRDTKQVDYLQGSCLMIRKKVIEEIGIFDEDFFMYFEETDFCYRAKRKGWSITRLGDCSIIHFGGGETGYYDEFRLLQYTRSLILFYKKHYSITAVLALKVILSLRNITRLILWLLIGLTLRNRRKESKSRLKGYFKSFKLLLD
ncbi:MAG: glycosyltransferase family 2 protein [Elusimicrobia bacterium]|nr:glycosyltransferase family 2 protein [Elusimicrobiota bacterium]